MAKRKYKRLHYEDRQTIEAMSKQGLSLIHIYADMVVLNEDFDLVQTISYGKLA